MDGFNFLQTIFKTADPQLFTYIWTRTNETKYKKVNSFDLGNLKKLSKVARNLNKSKLHVSYSMGLLDHPLGTYERPKSVDIVAIPCLWCDIDISSDVHGQKEKLAPDIETARSFLPSELPPSIIVDSGFGIHAYWILDALLWTKTDSDRSRAKKLLTNLQAIIRHNAGEYFIDPTADLARMLRLPDTVNWKCKDEKDAPICHVIEESDIRYNVDSIEATLDTILRKFSPPPDNPRQISSAQRDYLANKKNESADSDLHLQSDSAQKLMENCAFCKYCFDNIKSLSHAEFLDFFPNLLRSQNGKQIAIDLCKLRFADHFEESKSLTQIDSMSKLTPTTCERIHSLHHSCDPSSCIVAKAGKKSPCAILLSPAVKRSISAGSIGEIFPDSPDSIRNLKIPDGFEVGKTRILDARGKYAKTIFHTPVFVSREIVESDSFSPALYELTFLKRGKWYTSRVKPNSISDAGTLSKTLPDLGILISSKLAGVAAEFFQAFIEENELEIPVIQHFSKLGWYKGKFILPQLNDGSYLIKELTSYSKLRRAGSRDVSLNLLRDVSKYPFARLMIDANLAAPLLEFTDCRNFIIDIYAKSHSGKSMGLQFANSLWGAQDWMKSFNATTNATEDFAADRNSLPTNINEWQMTNSRYRDEIANQIVHRFSEGEGRSRLNRDGTPKPTKSWRGILITTSEEPLTAEDAFQGVKTRCLEIQAPIIIGTNDHGITTLDQELCKKIHRQTLHHYGHLGPEFIQKLQEEFRNDPKYERILSESHSFFDLIMKSREDRLIESYAEYLSSLACAHVRINMWFLLMNAADAMKETIQFLEFFATLIAGEQEILDIERAKYSIMDWVNAYPEHFTPETEAVDVDDRPEHARDNQLFKPRAKDPRFGYWDRGELYVIPSELKRALVDRGFKPLKILREWADARYIEVATGGNRLALLRKNPDGKREYVIGLSFLHDADTEYFAQHVKDQSSQQTSPEHSQTDDDEDAPLPDW